MSLTVHFVLAKLMEKLTADLALLRKAFNCEDADNIELILELVEIELVL